MNNSQHINEKSQKLLMRYSDGCYAHAYWGWFGRYQAKKLMEKSAAARKYVSDLEKTSASLKQVLGSFNTSKSSTVTVDLWDRIENRIEQEQRAAFYLGERVLVNDAPSDKSSYNLFNKFRLKGGWLIGIPAGAVAALVAVVAAGGNVGSLNQSAFISASLPFSESVRSSNALVPVAQTVSSNPSISNSQMELEWLRSHGRVQVIQQGHNQVPVIWVSRSDAIRRWQATNSQNANSQNANNRNAVRAASVPTRNSNGIEIIERAIPRAVTVANE